MMKKFLVLVMICIFGGCAKQIQTSSNQDYELKNYAPFEVDVLETDPFQIFTLVKQTKQSRTARIYIEGDGGSKEPSYFPTPEYPLGFYLAKKDDADLVIYIARPCQYVQNKHCQETFWMDKRFSKETILSIDQALDQLKEQYQFSKIELIGFSGGGAMAVYLASLRDDVVSLRTVAGALDLDYIQNHYGIHFDEETINPMSLAEAIAHIPQIHFYGAKDQIIPEQSVYNFFKAQRQTKNSQITVVPNAKHIIGWEIVWPDLLKMPINNPDQKLLIHNE